MSYIQRKYIITLSTDERNELESITSKGKHKSQKYQNALILLNCDESEYKKKKYTNEIISGILNISMRKIDHVKKRFVEDGLEITLNGIESERVYEKKLMVILKHILLHLAVLIHQKVIVSGHCDY